MKKIVQIFSIVLLIFGLFLYSTNFIKANEEAQISTRAFQQINEDGFGSRHNSYAWSMAFFKEKLYVGTNRDFFCYMAMLFSENYPPTTLNIDCPEEPDFRAEIWCFDPQLNTWERVFRSPYDFSRNEVVARDMGFRGMNVVMESDGTEALYIGGYSSTVLDDFPARILRTTDGKTFREVKSSAPLILENKNIISFRASEFHNGRLYYSIELPYPVNPKIIESDLTIKAIDDTTVTVDFREVSPPGLHPQEMISFNGYLYVGTIDPVNGFTIAKSDCKGDPPYTFKEVVTNGAYRVDRDGNEAHNLNEYAISMCAFKNRLYVGTGCGIGGLDFINNIGPAAAEMIRINTDDTWQLVCGERRNTPDGFKIPLSQMSAGLGNPCVGYFWRMEVYDDWLYVSATDSSVALLSSELWIDKVPDKYKELIEKYGDNVVDLMGGFDLWKTRNGIQWYPVTLRGFGDPFNIV